VNDESDLHPTKLSVHRISTEAGTLIAFNDEQP
jgi:hypothetical protein